VELHPNIDGRRLTVPAAFDLAISSPGARMWVSFAVTDPYVERIRVHGIGDEIAFGREGYEASVALEGELSRFTIGYSADYREGVPEGTRAVPVQATITLVY
jgi:hypothetical protein